ncbi:putative RNA-directed DNA polymerase [Rosa chinensis]|uniref:Putative RNA-directed DNA polymerase n=1 Tax=Rosa chinensis TaxID=74649 RepID=A0A2P6P7P2_ROSCH|nr:putative RNA-directed DNA polymerase [Rosa chinensis]
MYVILTSAYLINRTSTPILKGKTPFEMLFHKVPNYLHLRVFGCLCFASTHPYKPSKFDARSTKCIFLGYPHGQKGYSVYDLEKQKVLVSRDVVFYEDSFPFQSASYSHSTNHDPIFLPQTAPSSFDHEISSNTQDSLPINPPTDLTSSPNTSYESIIPLNTESSLESVIPSSPPTNSAPVPLSQSPPIRRSSRPTKTPSFLQDFHIEDALPSRPPHSSSTNKAPQCTTHSLSNVFSYTRLSPNHRAFTTKLTIQKEPTSFLQAVKCLQWREVMHKEIQALRSNHTWSLVSLPSNKRPIGCKWVYKIKLNPDGSVERHKARLVAKGYNQIEEVDYRETFSLVAKLTTVQVLLSLATMKGWHLHQLDVNNAFLNGDLYEEVYMQLPPGFERNGETRVCKLHKSIYGLK